MCGHKFSNTLDIPCGKSLFKEIHFYMCVRVCVSVSVCVHVHTIYYLSCRFTAIKKKAFLGVYCTS